MSRLLQLDKAGDLKLSVPMTLIVMFEKQVLARVIDKTEPVGNHAVRLQSGICEVVSIRIKSNQYQYT